MNKRERISKIINQGRGKNTDMPGVDLSDASLWGVYLIYANLRGANLKGINLEDADLSEANLRGADMRGANLVNAYIGWANLRGANLKGANLYGSKVIGAKYDKDTIWPDGFDPVKAGAIAENKLKEEKKRKGKINE